LRGRPPLCTLFNPRPSPGLQPKFFDFPPFLPGSSPGITSAASAGFVLAEKFYLPFFFFITQRVRPTLIFGLEPLPPKIGSRSCPPDRGPTQGCIFRLFSPGQAPSPSWRPPAPPVFFLRRPPSLVAFFFVFSAGLSTPYPRLGPFSLSHCCCFIVLFFLSRGFSSLSHTFPSKDVPPGRLVRLSFRRDGFLLGTDVMETRLCLGRLRKSTLGECKNPFSTRLNLLGPRPPQRWLFSHQSFGCFFFFK